MRPADGEIPEPVDPRLVTWYALSGGLHLLLLLAVLVGSRGHMLATGQEIPWAPTNAHLVLGYEGPTRSTGQLEALDPNSILGPRYQRPQGPRLAPTRAPERSGARPDPHGARPIETRATVESDAVDEPVAQSDVVPLESQFPGVQQIGMHTELPTSSDFVIRRLVKPLYPEREDRLGIRADIDLGVLIGPEGDVLQVEVRNAVTSPPGASTVPFEIAAIEAVRQWLIRLPPEYENGVWVTVPIQFLHPDSLDFIGPGGVRRR